MRGSRLRATLVAAALSVLVAPTVRSAGLDYRIDVRREGDTAAIDVNVSLARYEGHSIRFVLAAPPVAAETYFRFFDDISFSGPDGEPLAADPVAPGIYHLPAVDGDVRVAYRVLVGDLDRAEGSGHRLPAVDEAGAVLPLRALLAVPETDDGREIPLGTLTVTVVDGDRPVIVPWETTDGRAAFNLREAPDVVRSAIVVTGDAHVVDGRDEGIGAYVIVRGGDPATGPRAAEIVFRLVKHYAKAFGYTGTAPLTVVWELGAGETDAVDSGAFLRARSPATYLSATPAELTYGSDAYDFYRMLAHETFHRWIGADGIARPSGPELFWFSEGAAEYLGTIALVRTGLAEPRTVPEALAGRAASVHAHPERARAIDGDEREYASSRAYREILVLKAPLVCFLLDTQLVDTDPSRGLEVVAQGLILTAFMRGSVNEPVFRPKDLVQKLEAIVGPQGPAAATTYVSGAVGPLLAPRARAVGIEWPDGAGEDGPEPTLVEGGAFARRLALDAPTP